MKLQEFLVEHRAAISEKWFLRVLESYPPETVQVMKRQSDRIANPLGYVLNEMTETVMGALIDCKGREAVAAALYPAIQVRAVQDYKPSEALFPVFILKEVVARELQGKGDDTPREAMDEMHVIMDEISQIAFDIYMECRQKLFEVKEDELKRNLYMLLRKNDLVADNESSG
ncbi:RsbRD N-terminal domain-containing protein [Nitrospirota bacterium]